MCTVHYSSNVIEKGQLIVQGYLKCVGSDGMCNLSEKKKWSRPITNISCMGATRTFLNASGKIAVKLYCTLCPQL